MDYVQWRLLRSHGRYLDQTMLDTRFEYTKAIYGIKSQTLRDEVCVDEVDSNLDFMLGKLYVDEAFSGNSMERISELLKEVDAAFSHNIENIDWMEDETK